MDWLFNLFIPKSTSEVYIIRPKGKTFINGIASSYSSQYDEEILGEYINHQDFKYMIDYFNEILFNMWPCPLCFWIGYVFAIFSCGASFFLPYQCIKDAETSLH